MANKKEKKINNQLAKGIRWRRRKRRDSLNENKMNPITSFHVIAAISAILAADVVLLVLPAIVVVVFVVIALIICIFSAVGILL